MKTRHHYTTTPAAPTILAGLAAISLLTAACGGGKTADRGGTPTQAGTQAAAGAGAQARKEAKEIFTNRCTPCHGNNGGGDGPGSAGLTPKPRDFRSAEWQKSVTDEHIEKAIVYGGAAVGRSAAMPGNPDLAAKKEVVAALRMFIRKLEKP
jgi:mono/diheme cytochrome c family protein